MSQALTAWDDPEFVQTWNDTYGLDMRHAPIRGQFVFPWIADQLGETCGKTLIDIGCGNGNLVRHFQAANFARIVGIDPGAAVIESARLSQHAPHVSFVHASGSQPLPIDQTGVDFDVATSVFVVEEIPQADFQKYCSVIRDVLKPNGKALIFTNHPVNALAEDMASVMSGTPNKKFPNHAGYFDREPSLYTLEIMNAGKGFGKKAEYHHKTMATIINTFSTASLSLRSMIEVPRGMVSYAERDTHKPKSGDVPRFAGFVFQKA